MSEDKLEITEKTKIVRTPQRASYSREEAYEIIDSTPMCHVSYVIDGEPYITPTLKWRSEDNFFGMVHLQVDFSGLLKVPQ